MADIFAYFFHRFTSSYLCIWHTYAIWGTCLFLRHILETIQGSTNCCTNCIFWQFFLIFFAYIENLYRKYIENFLMTLLTSYDISANGITLPIKSCFASFHLSWPKEYNGAIYDATDVEWCWPSTNGVTWPESHVAPHFDCLDLRNVMVPLASCDASMNGVTWPELMLQLSLIVLT